MKNDGWTDGMRESEDIGKRGCDGGRERGTEELDMLSKGKKDQIPCSRSQGESNPYSAEGCTRPPFREQPQQAHHQLGAIGGALGGGSVLVDQGWIPLFPRKSCMIVHGDIGRGRMTEGNS